MSQYSEFCRHNPLCCFSMSNTKGKRKFLYRLSPETFGYTLVYPIENSIEAPCSLVTWDIILLMFDI